MASMRRARKPGFKELEPPPIPAHFRCPISLDLMRDPVTAPSGITYDRRSIEAWLDMGNATCPVTNRDIGSEPELIPNHSLRSRERAAEADGLVEGLFSLIKRPISAQATKAALVAAFRLVAYDKRTAARFAELGLVPLLLEALVDADRSFCERALAVLDAVLSSPRAKAESRDHALTVPVLLKKMFRVSDMATELVVSALYKLFKALMAKYKKEK
ncbi:U-box domain-containing protein 26 [Ananas comosus]|uniref:U-box domain-containing protein n=1 Tax=Ananas comosus TaxID=4615 RepID=A0A199UNQ6_ANACO|nr:U-box domain-containing protein 26 [Ananas comosus]